MDVSSLFKVPSVPAAKITANKRRMPEQPPDAALKRARSETGDDGEAAPADPASFRWGVGEDSGPSTANGGEKEADEEDARFLGDGLSDRQREILDLVDAAEECAPERIDLATVKRLALRLERAAAANEEQRLRFADEPLRFIESEADLDDALRGFLAASAAPQLYAQIVALGIAATAASLLAHENSDVAVAAVKLLAELTDEDVVADNEDPAEAEAGVKALVANLVQIIAFEFTSLRT
ncbi:hypothetical protein HK405_001049, partial [Cladochytrium tenue]